MSKKNTPSLSELLIKNLHASVQETPILRGIDLSIKPGEVHAVMGPNGSGKSTLAYALAGHPAYEVEIEGENKSQVTLDGEDVLALAPDERSQAGLFLAFQYPVEIPGVKVQNFLRLAHQARFANEPEKQFPTALAFRKHLAGLAEELEVNPELLRRGLNEGFSGGEKKRVEILQMAVLEPKYAILDETDSGLDVDAIKAVARGVNTIVKKYQTGVMLITHYQRILDYVKPDFVHVVVKGKIVKEGDGSLVKQLEETGYKQWLAD
jgi:Fe-S cluster assembly ATP-binding protein